MTNSQNLNKSKNSNNIMLKKARTKFFYDELNGSLFITNKKDKDIIKGSAEIGNIILDFTTDGRIVNIEINDILEFLKNLNIDSSEIKKLKDASLSVHYRQDSISIILSLQLDKEIQRIPIFVPTGKISRKIIA